MAATASASLVAPVIQSRATAPKIVRPTAKPLTMPTPAAASKLYVRGPFPLPKGHWYGPESKNPKNHSGYATKDRQGISQIQAEVGSRVDGRYGTKTRDAVRSWQVAHKVTPADGLVGIDTWNALLLN